MSKFVGIAAAVEGNWHESALDEIRKFKILLYKSRWQVIGEIFEKLIPSKKRALCEKRKSYLALLNSYRPLIEKQYDLFSHYFYMWESYNCANGWDQQQIAKRGEKKSFEEIERLTIQLQQKLDEIGWPYRPILHAKDLLVSGATGHIYIKKATKYLEMLERHFQINTNQ